jgi:hypothetical protein
MGGYFKLSVHGANSGRKVAWLVYGCDKREDGVRGEPLLRIVVQELNDISGYKGTVNVWDDRYEYILVGTPCP